MKWFLGLTRPLPNPFLFYAPGKGLIRRLCWGMNFDQADKQSRTRVLLNGWGYICQGWIWHRSWLGLTVFNSSVEHLKEAVAVAKELTKFTDVNGEDGHGHGHGQAVKVSDVHLSISAAPLQGHHKVFLSKCKSWVSPEVNLPLENSLSDTNTFVKYAFAPWLFSGIRNIVLRTRGPGLDYRSVMAAINPRGPT